MYSTLRKRFMSRVKVWDLILTEPSIVDLLNLSKSKIQRYHLWDRHIVDELFTIRAGSKKFLKEMCYYPILLLMRFGGMKHGQRLDLMHKLLIHVEAPLFGNLQHTDAELGRIRAWDKESIVWCNRLFKEPL